MASQRSRLKMWRNDRGGKWSTRITWFERGDGEDIRLAMEDCERSVSIYPETKEQADHIWFMFKQGSPKDGDKTPFVSDLLLLLKQAGYEGIHPNYPKQEAVEESETVCKVVTLAVEVGVNACEKLLDALTKIHGLSDSITWEEVSEKTRGKVIIHVKTSEAVDGVKIVKAFNNRMFSVVETK